MSAFRLRDFLIIGLDETTACVSFGHLWSDIISPTPDIEVLAQLATKPPVRVAVVGADLALPRDIQVKQTD